MGAASFALFVSYFLTYVSGVPFSTDHSCNTADGGYQCFSHISHLWGQYSPYFSQAGESSISADVPDGCRITFVQVLSRHGARYPTDSKGPIYSTLIQGIQNNATRLNGKYAFLSDYSYNLGEEDLTPFGENEMVLSGTKFYHQYQDLASSNTPFVRASGQGRVIASGQKFIEGFQNAKGADPHAKPGQVAAEIDVIIHEGSTFNDTLDHGTCTKFEQNTLGDEVEAKFIKLIAPPIKERLEKDLPGVVLSDPEVIYLMDMCSYDTVARTPDGSDLSPFCGLFTHTEWTQYNYVKSLEKYYGFGGGNELGPTQGIGFTNEVIARMTQSPVHDHTSTNRTLDSNPDTFPLDAVLYADFGHDNPMTSTYFALGLYNGTSPLSQTEVESATEADGYSAAWTVPFGARMYIEMMKCGDSCGEPLVRVLINDRVVPLHGCAVDDLGRCRRDDFIQGLSFARSGGNWDSCFT